MAGKRVGAEEVYFDDFKVTQTKSPVVATNDYYAFGFQSVSNSRENSIEQKYLYNGKELQDELNLGWLDYGARQYDPAISRFLSIDPATDLMRRFSAYVYAFDNPIKFIDPDGMIPSEAGKEEQAEEKENEQNQQNQKPKEITIADVEKIISQLSSNASTGDILNAIVGALAEYENATIKGSTLNSLGEKKAKEKLDKLDPKKPSDQKKIDEINENLEKGKEVFDQIKEINKTGNEITVVPTGKKVVIEGAMDVTIKANNKITIVNASSNGIQLQLQGISIFLGDLTKVTIDSQGYAAKVKTAFGSVEKKEKWDKDQKK